MSVVNTVDGSEQLNGATVSRNPDVIWDRVDGEMLLCHTGTGAFYTLNEVGAFIWESCERISGEELMQRVCNAFVDEDKTPIVAAVEEFIAFLQGLLLWTSAGRRADMLTRRFTADERSRPKPGTSTEEQGHVAVRRVQHAGG